MQVPFYKFMFLRMISEPSSIHRLFIIQIGMWHMPSSAENSSTPQYVLRPICEFEIINVIGYWILRRASSCRADVGRMTDIKECESEFQTCNDAREFDFFARMPDLLLFPRLTSGLPMKAGLQHWYDRRKTFVGFAIPLPTLLLTMFPPRPSWPSY